jgi:hypothetical protein
LPLSRASLAGNQPVRDVSTNDVSMRVPVTSRFPAPAIGPIQKVLDKLAAEPLTVWEIWTTVTDQHYSDASYAAIRDYIRSRRPAGQSGSPLPGPGRSEGTP